MFENIIKGLPLEVNPKNLYLSMEDTNLESIKNKLFNLDNLSDQDLYNFVYKTYNYILDEMFIAKNGDLIKFLYTNSRFLMTFNSVLGRPDIELSYLQTIYCNKLAYDYFTAKGDKDSYIKDLLVNLIKTVNRSVMPSLIGLGLNEELAAYLVNARYSSLKENIQVRRLNLIIMNQPSEVMTVQMIVYIYGKLFERITPLFDGIMYDYWSNDQLVGNEMEEIYATINVAILEIVNNLPEDIMYHLLRNFRETYDLVNLNKKIRFNIYSFCKEDYPRLDYTLELLKQDGIVLPMS